MDSKEAEQLIDPITPTTIVPGQGEVQVPAAAPETGVTGDVPYSFLKKPRKGWKPAGGAASRAAAASEPAPPSPMPAATASTLAGVLGVGQQHPGLPTAECPAIVTPVRPHGTRVAGPATSAVPCAPVTTWGLPVMSGLGQYASMPWPATLPIGVAQAAFTQLVQFPIQLAGWGEVPPGMGPPQEERRMPLEHIKDMFAGTPYSGFIPGRMGTGLSGQYSVLGMLLHPSVAAGYQGLVDHWLNGTRSAVEKDRLCRAEHFVEQFDVDTISLEAAGFQLAEALPLAKAAAAYIHPAGLGVQAFLPAVSELDLTLVTPVRNQDRCGRGLVAAKDLPRGTVLGVIGGYVLPSGLADVCMGQLDQVASALGVSQSRLQFDVGRYAFNLPQPVASAALVSGFNVVGRCVIRGSPALALTIWGLGCGNLGMLMNGVETGDEANVAVVSILVRGMPIPFLVTTTSVAAQQPLLRPYGSGWRTTHDWLRDRAQLDELRVSACDSMLPLHASMAPVVP